jgi:hypothetical protein
LAGIIKSLHVIEAFLHPQDKSSKANFQALQSAQEVKLNFQSGYKTVHSGIVLEIPVLSIFLEKHRLLGLYNTANLGEFKPRKK